MNTTTLSSFQVPNAKMKRMSNFAKGQNEKKEHHKHTSTSTIYWWWRRSLVFPIFNHSLLVLLWYFWIFYCYLCMHKINSLFCCQQNFSSEIKWKRNKKKTQQQRHNDYTTRIHKLFDFISDPSIFFLYFPLWLFKIIPFIISNIMRT